MASLEKKEEKEKEIDEEENDHDYDEMANVEMIILLRHYDSHYDYLDPTEFGIGNTPIWSQNSYWVDSFDFPYSFPWSSPSSLSLSLLLLLCLHLLSFIHPLLPRFSLSLSLLLLSSVIL